MIFYYLLIIKQVNYQIKIIIKIYPLIKILKNIQTRIYPHYQYNSGSYTVLHTCDRLL